MKNFSHLDQKYFIDTNVYNCPYCNRNNVIYDIVENFQFDWTDEKKCYGFIAECSSCSKKSMHLSYEEVVNKRGLFNVSDKDDIDSMLFYSVPTSFFVIDSRIPNALRELITEADGCLKMNFLTGASVCAKKAIYELTKIENCSGDNYEDKIKSLKEKHKDTDESLFNILSNIQDMTSNKIHEQSWPKWNAKNLKLIIETLKTVLFDIHVLPKMKSERSNIIHKLLEDVKKRKDFIEIKTKEEKITADN